MFFKAEGYVHTEEPEHYVCEFPFNLERVTDSLKFEFYAEGKPIYFHVKDPAGIVRIQQMGSRDKKYSFLSNDYGISGPGTCPGKILNGEWKIIAFAFGARTNSRLGRVDFEVNIYEEKEDLQSAECAEIESIGRDQYPFGNYKSWLDRDELENEKIVLKDFESPSPVSGNNSCKWLKGDFHAHTYLSDGSASPQELLDEGISKKLDFFFITEHGILTTGFPEKKGLTVFPGYEATTASGHFNVLGLRFFPEDILYKGPYPEWDYLEKGVSEMKKRGALLSINHPFFKPWQWIYNSLPLALIDSIEIVTDPYDAKIGDSNETAVKMIDLLWNEGYRITGIGGSDTHTSFSQSQLGQPLTEVYAIQGSMKSLLEGVRHHNVAVYLDTDCRIRYSAEGEEIIPGTEIKTGNDVNLVITAVLPVDSDPMLLRIVENGTVSGEYEITPDMTALIGKKWSAKSEWIRCELRDMSGILRGFINPLHRGKRPGRIKTWGDAIEILES